MDLTDCIGLNIVSCNDYILVAKRGLYPDKNGKLYLSMCSRINDEKFNIWLTVKSAELFKKGDKPYDRLYFLQRSSINGVPSFYLGLYEEYIEGDNWDNLISSVNSFSEFQELIYNRLQTQEFSFNIDKHSNLMLEIANYCWIALALENRFNVHWKVNQFIEENELWDDFINIRSRNYHRNGSEVLGIQPKYFSITCKLMNLNADEGSPLESWESY